MLSVYLCDDDYFWLERLNKALTDYQIMSDLEISLEYSGASPSCLLQHLKNHPSANGIFFLDINFKGSFNGLELAKRIRELDPHASLIIVTTHEELAVETFHLKLEILDYIVKDKGDLRSQVHKCLEHIELRFKSPQNKERNTITFRENGSYIVLSQDEIYFVETIKNSHKICIHQKSSIHMISSSLSSIQNQLGSDFILCHKTCLVNIRHIRKLNHPDRLLLLDNGECCSCSARQWKPIISSLNGL